MLQVSKFPLAAMYGMCTLFLAIAAVCQYHLCELTAHLHPNRGPTHVRLDPDAVPLKAGKESGVGDEAVVATV